MRGIRRSECAALPHHPPRPPPTGQTDLPLVEECHLSLTDKVLSLDAPLSPVVLVHWITVTGKLHAGTHEQIIIGNCSDSTSGWLSPATIYLRSPVVALSRR